MSYGIDNLEGRVSQIEQMPDETKKTLSDAILMTIRGELATQMHRYRALFTGR